MEFRKYKNEEIDKIEALFVNTFSDSEGDAEGKLSYPEGWLGQNLNNGKVPVIPGASYFVEALNYQKY
jgi:hypothetical protein